MKVLNKKSSKLPFVERDIFGKLMRLGLDFDKRQGAYYVEDYNEVEKIIDIIGSKKEIEENAKAKIPEFWGDDNTKLSVMVVTSKEKQNLEIC